ncbi:MAG: thioredoxin family protein [Hyphomonadaceae bacterium]
MRALWIVLALCVLGANASAQTRTPLDRGLYYIQDYDAARNPEADLNRVVARASETNLRILLMVGGDWCAWCHILDDYIARNAVVREEFGQSFIILKVNMNQRNRNEEFLSRFPLSNGYPDFFVLESDGSFLAQQDTNELERGNGYDRDRMIAFARQWRR